MALPPMRHDGGRELRSARSAAWQLYISVGIFSFAVNLLMLTGPLFMMQVYDRVLASRSVETLTALFLLVVFLFTMMGLLDLARNRVMARVAAGDLQGEMPKAHPGSMLDSMGQMVAALRLMMRDINALSGQLARGAEQISTSSREVAQAAHKQSDATSSMAASVR